MKRRRKRRRNHRKKYEASNCGTKEPKRPSETHIEWQPQGKVNKLIKLFSLKASKCNFHSFSSQGNRSKQPQNAKPFAKEVLW